MNIAPLKAGASSYETGKSLVLDRVIIVDTRSGKLIPDVCIVIRAGKIARIAPSGTAVEGAPEIIDATGKFVVPGFLDMHTHLLQQENAPERSSALMLAHGITGIRQMAGTTEMLRARKAGTLTTGEHGPELLSLPGEILLPMNAPTPEAGVLEVQRQKAEGADFIKTIFVSPKVFFATLAEAKLQGLAYDGHLSPGVDVRKASEAGMTVVEHLGPTELQLIASSSKEWLINLILKMRPPKPPNLSPAAMKTAGRIMIANPILSRLNVDPKALQKTQQLIDSFSETKARSLGKIFAANGTWQCPTLIRDATMRLGDDPRYTASPDLRFVSASTRHFWAEVARSFSSKMSAASRETLKQLGELELKLTKIFDEEGVQMFTGSDYGGGWVVPGVSLHQEFDLLEEAGLSPLKVLQMATRNGAQFLGREATMGTVGEKKCANLVLLDDNPIKSAQNLHKITAVVRNGSYYPQQELTRIREHVAGTIALPKPDELDAADNIIA